MDPAVSRPPRSWIGELGAFLLGACCAGCDAPGALLCVACSAALAARPVVVRTPLGLTVHAGASFEGITARCIRRLKSDGETLLARPLGAILLAALAATEPDALPVPVPTGRAAFRRRGYRVPDLLLRRAGASPHSLLRVVAVRADQRGLDARQRAENVKATMVARRPGHGTRVVVVDDVVTTGATIDEAARALREAGYVVRGGVALAATPSHRGLMADSSTTRRK